MATLEGVEIFAIGEWNGIEFGASDLDEIVRGFEQEQQAGRLPVKLGHSAPDTEPARGWLSRVWREGDRLLARIEQVPAEIVDGIKSGAWRHVSVELLHHVETAAGKSYRWLLDGLALLGSARPAVDVLKPLHESLSRRARGMAFGQRLAFTREIPRDELAELRRENERLRLTMHRQSVEAAISADISSGRCLPAARETFTRLMRLASDADYQRVTLADWQAFRATQPKAPSAAATSRTAATTMNAARADAELVERVETFRKDHPGLDYFTATMRVLRADPDLAQRYRHMPGTE
jgi:hypothetical protein